MTAKCYPNWVLEYKKPGYVIKNEGGRYYYYKRTSHRIPGRKNPIPYDQYLGRLDESLGLISSDRHVLDVSDVIVYEYGFSHALLTLCPEGWKRAAGTNWENLLCAVILDASPSSYLSIHAEDNSSLSDPEIKTRVKGQMASLYRRIRDQYHVGKEELESLKSIYLLMFGRNKHVLSHITDTQKHLINSLNLSMEVH